MPVPFTATQIKAWFETADVPTQQQFADFVDTLFHMVQQANDTADAAKALAANTAKCWGLLTITYPGPSVAVTVERVEGCTVATSTAFISTAGTSGSYLWTYRTTVTLTPLTAFADVDVAVVANPLAKVTTRATGSLVFTFDTVFQQGVTASQQFNFLVMP